MRTRVLGGLVVLLASWLGPLAEFAWADLHYADFSSAGGLNLVGDAAVVGDRLRLTPLTYSESLRGAAWFTEKQNVAGPFELVFRFQVPVVAGLGADGFAFVIQNSDPHAIGDFGGNIAYGGDRLPGISNSLV